MSSEDTSATPTGANPVASHGPNNGGHESAAKNSAGGADDAAGSVDSTSAIDAGKGNSGPPQSSEKPSDASLEAALKLEVQDKDGKKVPLESLTRGDLEAPRVVIVFIRHFFCGLCQDYIRHLHRLLPPDTLSGFDPATRLIVVGHGDPSLIRKYTKETDCPYDIYADPSRRIYDRLGFVSNLRQNAKDPVYFKQGMLRNLASSIRQNLSVGSKIFSGGKISQNGGELVFTEGKLGYFYRMKTTTDHTEVEDLEKVLKA